MAGGNSLSVRTCRQRFRLNDRWFHSVGDKHDALCCLVGTAIIKQWLPLIVNTTFPQKSSNRSYGFLYMLNGHSLRLT